MSSMGSSGGFGGRQSQKEEAPPPPPVPQVKTNQAWRKFERHLQELVNEDSDEEPEPEVLPKFLANFDAPGLELLEFYLGNPLTMNNHSRE